MTWRYSIARPTTAWRRAPRRTRLSGAVTRIATGFGTVLTYQAAGANVGRVAGDRTGGPRNPPRQSAPAAPAPTPTADWAAPVLFEVGSFAAHGRSGWIRRDATAAAGSGAARRGVTARRPGWKMPNSGGKRTSPPATSGS